MIARNMEEKSKAINATTTLPNVKKAIKVLNESIEKHESNKDK